MTKEEIANIKRIDTSLNVFRKKLERISVSIETLTDEFNRKLEPLKEECINCTAEIDFWQKPVIDRYGKTTTELLREAGEETAGDISSDEEKETVKEPETEKPEEKPAGENPEAQEMSDDSPVDETQNDESEDDGLGLNPLPEEWED